MKERTLLSSYPRQEKGVPTLPVTMMQHNSPYYDISGLDVLHDSNAGLELAFKEAEQSLLFSFETAS